MLKKVTDLTSGDFSKGLNTNGNILSLEKNQSPNMMNVKVNADLSIQKRMGTNTQNAIAIAQSGGAGFTTDSNNLLLSSIVAYWKLDEVAGTRADSISTHTLQDGNTVGQASGIKRSAANFVAANSQYLLINNTATLATGDVDFSMAAWFYLTSTGDRTIISKRDYPSDTQNVLLLHCDGADASTTFTDSSTSNKTMTANGNAQIDTAQSKFGGASALFDGTGDYLTTADSNDWNFSTGNFTIDFWVRFNSVGNAGFVGQVQDGSNFWALDMETTQVTFYDAVGASVDIQVSFPWVPSTGVWYHVAFVRSVNNFMLFVDGVQQGTTQTDASAVGNFTGNLQIGRSARLGSLAELNGWMDEIRISKGIARWTSNFSVPTSAYVNPTIGSQLEYSLRVGTDSVVVFEVSSSGTAVNGTVSATSFGAVSTATWYNAVAWHDTGDRIGVSVNLSATTASYASGVRAGSAPFVIGAVSNGTSLYMDGRIDEAGFWKRVLTAADRANIYNSGSGNTYNLAFLPQPWASFDFGANNLRWLTVAAGTGIYASQNLGVTFVNIATDRTATYQFFERSKNSLIATSDAYDVPLQWTGSSNTFATMLNPSAPLAKYSTNFQGFLILLNTQARKRGFFYEDENTQITGDWGDSFDIPSSADDELTGSIQLRKNLYVSTRYSLYRLTFIGGNPDWSFKKVKDWGFVPRTIKVVSLKDVGEVAVGLDWSRKLRLFDGTDDKIISTDIENDNTMCDFGMDKISYALSGLTISHAELDSNENVYKLCVGIGANTESTTHFINFDGRTMAFYPDSNRPFNTMTMAESANKRQLLAFDRSGFCHLMDSGNLDANRTPINDVFDFPFLYEKSPSAISKSNKIDLYFSPTSAGTLHYQDRVDFSSTFKPNDRFSITNDGTVVQVKKPINIPQTASVYQGRLTSSSGTSDPWILNRTDYFLQSLGIGDSK